MKKTKIVIVGAGFAGVYTAKHLTKQLKANASIELINDNNYFVFQPLLPEVASGTLSAQDAVVTLRALVPGCKVRQAEVVSIDRDNQTVQLLQGSRRTIISIDYDQLIITSGTQANAAIVKGMESHAFTIKNLSDAYHIRNHIIQCLEWADVSIDPQTKKRLLTFVVTGGGFSGVETIGEVVEMIHRALRYYPSISKDEIKAIIVQSGDCLLPELHPKLGAYTVQRFAKRGIEVVLNTRAERMTHSCVMLNNGRHIDTATVISSIGNKTPEFVASLNLELMRGKLAVEQDLRVKGTQNIWALGDIAAIPLDSSGTQFAPPTAQFAVAEAASCAANVVNQLNDKPLRAFKFKPKGSLASLGSYSGVGEVFGIRLTGILGWAVWRGFYILKIPGFATKIRITLNWFYDYFLPRNIVHLQQKEISGLKEGHYNKGDIVFSKGQRLDALYIVKTGRCVFDDGRGFHREYAPGEHFGERQLDENRALDGDFRALEDSVMLELERSQLCSLRDALPPLNEYFSHIEESQYQDNSLTEH